MVNPFPVMQTNSQSPEDSGPITGSYGHRKPISQLPRQPRGIGRESVSNASGPASPTLTEQGRRVGSLGPGLACESADAFRAVLRIDLLPGPRFFWHPPAVPA